MKQHSSGFTSTGGRVSLLLRAKWGLAVTLVVDDSLQQALPLGSRGADLVDCGGAIGVVVDVRLKAA